MKHPSFFRQFDDLDMGCQSDDEVSTPAEWIFVSEKANQNCKCLRCNALKCMSQFLGLDEPPGDSSMMPLVRS